MTPAITAVRMTGARNRAELPLLVLGPSPGTSASVLWRDCATHLADAFDVLAWDLPGHGHNRAVPDEQSSVTELAAGVIQVVDDVLAQRGDVGGSFFHAGASVGGAVGLQLLHHAPGRVTSAVQLDDVTRLAPDEAPGAVARLLRAHFLGEVFAETDTDADGAEVADAEFTRDVQEVVTQHASGSLWSRAGLDPRSRSLVSLTALVAQGHHEELETSLRTARAHGLTLVEVRELLLQAAIHGGVPDASAAFRIANRVLTEEPPAGS